MRPFPSPPLARRAVSVRGNIGRFVQHVKDNLSSLKAAAVVSMKTRRGAGVDCEAKMEGEKERQAALEPGYTINVNGRPWRCPESVISEAAWVIDLSIGAYIPLDLYAESVADVLSAFETNLLLRLRRGEF